VEYFLSTTNYLNTNMDRPVFRDTSHLTERQKCALALAQALENNHSEYRIQALTSRLMRYSIMCLNDNSFSYKDEC